MNIQKQAINLGRDPAIRNSSADENSLVAKPWASNRSLVALSMLGSSSTIAMVFCRFAMDAFGFDPFWASLGCWLNFHVQLMTDAASEGTCP